MWGDHADRIASGPGLRWDDPVPEQVEDTDRAERGSPPRAAQVGAAVLVAVAVVTTFRPWTVAFDGGSSVPDSTVVLGSSPVVGRSMWASGAGTAVGAGLLLVGAVLVAVAAVTTQRVRTVTTAASLIAAGVAAVVGTVVLLADRYPFGSGFAPVTVAIARFGVGPNQSTTALVTPASAAWVLVIAAAVLALAVVVAAARRRPTASPGPTLVVALVGAPALVGVLALVVGSTALPWRIGPSLRGEALWRSGPVGATAAVLVLVAGLLAVTAIGWSTAGPRRAVFATASLLAAAVGLGLLVSDRVPASAGDLTFGWYAYQPLAALNTFPSAGALHAAVALVLGGGVLVVLAAAAATWLFPPARPAGDALARPVAAT